MRDDRIIGDYNIYEMLTYMYASYGMPDDIIGHTGGCMTFGWGLIHAKPAKNKLNTKSSTESEVIGAIYYIQFIIWLAMYMDKPRV